MFLIIQILIHLTIDSLTNITLLLEKISIIRQHLTHHRIILKLYLSIQHLHSSHLYNHRILISPQSPHHTLHLLLQIMSQYPLMLTHQSQSSAINTLISNHYQHIQYLYHLTHIHQIQKQIITEPLCQSPPHITHSFLPLLLLILLTLPYTCQSLLQLKYLLIQILCH